MMALKLIIGLIKMESILGVGKVNLSMESVKQVFSELLAEKITREQADRWAYQIIKAEESKMLVIDDKEPLLVWEAVMFLYGIDLMESPGEYLHTKSDIDVFLKEKLI